MCVDSGMWHGAALRPHPDTPGPSSYVWWKGSIPPLPLLDLPNGLRFTAIAAPRFSDQDVGSMIDFGSRCSDTQGCHNYKPPLGYVSFDNPCPIEILNPRKLISGFFARPFQGDETPRGDIWVQNLRCPMDRCGAPDYLIQKYTKDHIRHLIKRSRIWIPCWTDSGLRLKIMYESTGWLTDERERLRSLLPQISRRGIVDMVEYPYVQEAFPSFGRF